MKVHYRSRAVADLDEIHKYLTERNPRAARNVVDAISDAIAQIAKFPLSAGRTTDLDIRVKIVQKYPYKIYYEVGNDRIDILHVRHGARQPWFSEK
jgi:plasmid stabilization system protein ParE